METKGMFREWFWWQIAVCCEPEDLLNDTTCEFVYDLV